MPVRPGKPIEHEKPVEEVASTGGSAQSLAVLARLVDLCSEPAMVTDAEDHICHLNPSALAWFGFSAAELLSGERADYLRVLGLDIPALLTDSAAAAQLALGLQARAIRLRPDQERGQSIVTVRGVPCPIGEWVYVVWMLPLSNPGEAVSSGSFEGMQANLLDQLSFAVLLVDTAGRPFYRNKIWIRWLEDAAIDATMFSSLAVAAELSAGVNHLEQATQRAITSIIASQKYDAWTEFPVDGCGDRSWFEINLRPMSWEGEAFYCVEITNCTGRHAAQEEVRQSEQRFRDLAEISSDWFWETGPDMKLRYISDRFQLITGISPDDLLGKSRAELADAEMRETDYWHQHWSAVQAHESFRNFQYSMLRPDGSEANIALSGTPIFDGQGLFLGYRGVGADVSRLIEAEKSKRFYEQRVAHTQRLEALGTLAGGIAHDINNALLPIINMVKMVARHLPEDSKDHAKLQIAVEAANHCKTLVKSILDFSRQQDTVKSPCNMTTILREAVGLLQSTIPSTIHLDTRLPNRSIEMIADAAQIKQLLVNLAKNAADAIGLQPGRIMIDCSVIDAADMAEVKTLQGALLRLVVRDTGQGMDEATKTRLFEPFFTTKAPGEGTGLGLSIVHSVVKSHDGVIEVDSVLGEGTEFRIYLPLGVRPTEIDHVETRSNNADPGDR